MARHQAAPKGSSVFTLAMRNVVIVTGIIAFLIVFALLTDMVGVRYPRVIQDEPLQHPQKVISVQGNDHHLGNGVVVTMSSLKASEIDNILRQSNFEIDVGSFGVR